MSRHRPFRFGVQASRATDGKSVADLARRVEDLGFSTLLMPDQPAFPLAAIPALSTAAQATTRLRVGGLVLDTELEHPAVLATELATLHLLSGGRLEVGLGEGWLKT